ncbi:MAG: sigma-54-dependent Fis family transcriptional regulator, partial [Gemmatimonadetes bacterium]|nr:sigma-54-dependent Fis family transcriptional regulator [Gemmatimonadota bacterium]
TDEIIPLAERFLAKLAPEGQPPATLSPAARDVLLAYDWPGNVRELQNRMQRATLVCKDGTIEPGDLGLDESAAAPADEELDPERAATEEALVRAKGVVSKAAASLGLSRQALYRRMRRLDIVLERLPRA